MLTDITVRALKPRKHVYRIREKGHPEAKGFGVAVSPSGTKTFFISFTSPEAVNQSETPLRRQMALGKYPGTSLSDAREKARNARNLIEDGKDPVLEKQRMEAEAEFKKELQEEKERLENSLGTVGQLFEFYIKDMEADGKRSAGSVRAIYEYNVAPVIGNKKTRDVTLDDCADIITSVAERGAVVQANRVRSYLRAAFEFGLAAHQMPRWRRKVPEFGLHFNPAAQTRRAVRETEGDRYLSKDEVLDFWKRSEKEMNPNTALSLKLLLATGQRVEEVLGATWSEFDLDEQLWTIPGKRRKSRHKTVKDHLVPITEFHIELLRQIQEFSEGDNYLFPKTMKHGRVREPRSSDSLSQAVRRFCVPQDKYRRPIEKTVRKGFTRFTPRDIRRTWKTLTGSMGLGLDIRNRIQGHALRDVGSLHYDRYDYLDEKREAMRRWSDWLKELVG